MIAVVRPTPTEVLMDPMPLCSVCAQRPARSRKLRSTTDIHRCVACYHFHRTHGFDRSVAMTERQRQRDEERRCSDRASGVVGSSSPAVDADRANVSDTLPRTAATGDEHDRR